MVGADDLVIVFCRQSKMSSKLPVPELEHVKQSLSSSKCEDVIDSSKSNCDLNSKAGIVEQFKKSLCISQNRTAEVTERSPGLKEILEDPKKQAQMVADHPSIYAYNSPDDIIVLEKEDDEIWNVPADVIKNMKPIPFNLLIGNF